MASAGDDKREALLEAGIDLLAERPFSRITMNDIAQRSGVTKPMIYYYFGSKEGFYRGLARFVISSVREEVMRALRTDCTLRETFEHYSRMRLEYARMNPRRTKAIHRLFSDENIGEYIADLVEELEKFLDIWKPLFEEAAERGEIRPDTGCWLVLEMLNSTLTHFMMHELLGSSIPGKYEPDPEALVDLIFRGIESDGRST